MFYAPEVLRNLNGLNLGQTQHKVTVDNVGLPPWAASPEEFVRINRQALESDYVSNHLHLWIDLIFGCKQRGANAVEAKNLFFYLTYSGVDLESGDPEQYVNKPLKPFLDTCTSTIISLFFAGLFVKCQVQGDYGPDSQLWPDTHPAVHVRTPQTLQHGPRLGTHPNQVTVRQPALLLLPDHSSIL